MDNSKGFENYWHTCGKFCPFCSSNISKGVIVPNDWYTHREAHCLHCGSSWNEVWEITGLSSVIDKSEEIRRAQERKADQPDHTPSSTGEEEEAPPGKPNPLNFKITHSEQIGEMLIVIAVSPDCPNREAADVLVYENTEIERLIKCGTIDSEFHVEKVKCQLVAKFRSSLASGEGFGVGLIMARQFCNSYQNMSSGNSWTQSVERSLRDSGGG